MHRDWTADGSGGKWLVRINKSEIILGIISRIVISSHWRSEIRKC